MTGPQDLPAKHGESHMPGGDDPTIWGQFDIKVFSDLTPTATGDGKFTFAIPDDLTGRSLVRAHAYVTTAGSGFSLIQIRNVTQALDLLSTRIRIDASEFTSYTSSVPAVVTAGQPVETGDLISIDVDTAGADSKGLGVILDFA